MRDKKIHESQNHMWYGFAFPLLHSTVTIRKHV